MIRKFRPLIKSLTALAVNISAIYFGLIFIPPHVTNSLFENLVTLTQNTVYGILFLVASVFLEALID